MKETTNFGASTMKTIHGKMLTDDELLFANKVTLTYRGNIFYPCILDASSPLLKDDAEMVCLIKPQFEAGREKVGKKGVVRDPAVHEEVINTIIDFVKEIGFYVLHLEFSPIKGPEGNIEYLIHISTADKKGEAIDVAATVAEAHGSLDK